MYLEQVGTFNDLSPKLRDELTDKLRSFGKRVRFKFDIAKPNPDPTQYEGIKVIYPNVYTLDPCVFNILDPYEDRKDKQKSKRIGLVDTVKENGQPERFFKIRVKGAERSILSIELNEGSEEWYKAMMLLVHPKLEGGKFSDSTKAQVVSIIDEKAAATTERLQRSARIKAMNVAEGMSSQEVINFADAMSWDSTEDETVLRNNIENLAQDDPKYFNELVESKSIEFKSVIKKCLDRKHIEFNPGEYNFKWVGNNMIIVQLSPAGDKTEIEKFADWLQHNGQKGDDIFKKMKSLVK